MSDKEQRIRVRAYAIWEEEGRHDGRAEERWRQAELEIEQALRSAEAQAAEAPEQPPKAAGNRARTSIGPIDRIVPAMIEADRHQALRPPTEALRPPTEFPFAQRPRMDETGMVGVAGMEIGSVLVRASPSLSLI